ncbi:hypothetical protein AB5I41_03285 [Sphingomonas sp. MMS24-JH45]
MLGEFFAFAQDLYERRRAEPGEDIATMLAHAEIDGQPAPFQDFVANLILVLVGGNETTRNSLSHTMTTFAEQPELWDALRADPALLKTATREMVRHAEPGPAHAPHRDARHRAGRRARARRRPGGHVVRQRQSRRARLRTPTPSASIAATWRTSLGSGQHVCVGSRLAEMQLRVAFETLAPRIPPLRGRRPRPAPACGRTSSTG